MSFRLLSGLVGTCQEFVRSCQELSGLVGSLSGVCRELWGVVGSLWGMWILWNLTLKESQLWSIKFQPNSLFPRFCGVSLGKAFRHLQDRSNLFSIKLLFLGVLTCRVVWISLFAKNINYRCKRRQNPLWNVFFGKTSPKFAQSRRACRSKTRQGRTCVGMLRWCTESEIEKAASPYR